MLDDKNLLNTNTEGGAYVGQDVTVGRDFAGRDINTTNVNHSQFVNQIINEATRYVPSALYQLRPIPPSFTGRFDEINDITCRVKENQSRIIVIEGMAGVGKSALANFVGHILSKDFPDAQVFLSLNASTTTPVELKQAFLSCLFSFYPDFRLPDNNALLRSFYLSSLHGKRAIVILDDAPNEEYVELLTPPEGSLTIVTSRRSLQSGWPLVLNVLKRQDSNFMLKSLCLRLNDEQANNLATVCGDLPIALYIAAGHLKVNRAKPITEYIQSLQGQRRTELFDTVNGLFRISYQSLTQDLQSALQSLSVFPTDFDRLAGVAIIGQGDLSADKLDELLVRNLIFYNEKLGRYSWFELLREFVQQQTPLDKIDLAKARYLEYFIKAVQEIHRLYQLGSEQTIVSLKLFDTELTHIRCALQFAHNNHETVNSPYLPDKLITLVEALTSVGPLRFDSKERIQWLTAEIEATRMTGQELLEGYALANLGFARFSIGEVEQAIECYQQGLKLAERMAAVQLKGLILGRLGFGYISSGDFARAINCYEQQLAIAQSTGDRHEEGIALNGLGMANFTMENLDQAVEHYEQSLKIRGEVGDHHGEAVVLNNLGVVCTALGKTLIAIKHYEKAQHLQELLGDRLGQAKVLGNLGNCSIALSKVEEANHYYSRQLRIAKDIADPWNESSALGNLGLVHTKLGDLQQAITYYEQQLFIVQQLGDRSSEGRCCFNLSLTYKKLNDLPLAKKYAEDAVKIFTAIKSPDIGETQNWLARLTQ